jgi:hypothetical protein
LIPVEFQGCYSDLVDVGSYLVSMMAILDKSLPIAPCGMNCHICRAYLRKRNKCPGCRGEDTNKPVTRVECKIKNCSFLQKMEINYCFECENFPCNNLNKLDSRYLTRYNMSVIENLKSINEIGINEFLVNEGSRWACSHCGCVICVHNGCCHICGKKK